MNYLINFFDIKCLKNINCDKYDLKDSLKLTN
jgi:hypothetical protein